MRRGMTPAQFLLNLLPYSGSLLLIYALIMERDTFGFLCLLSLPRRPVSPLHAILSAPAWSDVVPWPSFILVASMCGPMMRPCITCPMSVHHLSRAS